MKSYQMGDSAILAAQNTRNQLISAGYPNTKVGICPMIGINDVQNQIFTLDNARAVLAFAQSNTFVGLLTFWSANRDIAQTSTETNASAKKSGVVQANCEFGIIFNKFTSSP
jgi:hypothetical protein